MAKVFIKAISRKTLMYLQSTEKAHEFIGDRERSKTMGKKKGTALKKVRTKTGRKEWKKGSRGRKRLTSTPLDKKERRFCVERSYTTCGTVISLYQEEGIGLVVNGDFQKTRF